MVPGLLFVIDLVPFNNLLNNVDLPTFERPVIKTLYCVNLFSNSKSQPINQKLLFYPI